MTPTTYHFTFKENVCLDAIEDALVLAAIAATAVAKDPGEAYEFDARRRTCVIDGRSAAGRALVRVFFAYVLGMFGPRAFRVVTAEDLAEQRRPRARRSCRCGRAGARR